MPLTDTLTVKDEGTKSIRGATLNSLKSALKRYGLCDIPDDSRASYVAEY